MKTIYKFDNQVVAKCCYDYLQTMVEVVPLYSLIELLSDCSFEIPDTARTGSLYWEECELICNAFVAGFNAK